MTTGTTCVRLAAIGMLLLATASFAGAAQAQNIYKCTQDGHVSYTDTPCPGKSGELLHQASDADIIDQYLRLGENARAQAYAKSHHLDALYTERLAAHEQAAQDRLAQAKADAAAAQQQAAAARQQALIDAAADSAELRAQNRLLREQNDQYQDQLAQPAYGVVPYWNLVPTYSGRRPHRGDRDDHGQDHAPPKPPMYHPCTVLAGGRVNC